MRNVRGGVRTKVLDGSMEPAVTVVQPQRLGELRNRASFVCCTIRLLSVYERVPLGLEYNHSLMVAQGDSPIN